MAPVRVEVYASAPRHIPGVYEPAPDRPEFELRPGEARTGVDIELDAGGTAIHGIVKDITGGVIEGAIVQNRTPRSYHVIAKGRTIATTDADGKFTLWLGPGDALLAADADGYATGEAFGPTPGSLFEIVLTPESVLVGIVVSAKDGSPVSDVRVDAGADASSGASDGVAYTDAQGQFRIEGLLPGRYKPSARGSTGYGRASRSVRLGLAGTVDDVRIELQPATTIDARVVIASEPAEPCQRGSVWLQDQRTRRRVVAAVHADGSVQLVGVLPGTYDVNVTCEGMISGEHYDALAVESEPITDRVWHVDEALALTGLVIGPDGTPVPDVSISAHAKTHALRGPTSNPTSETTSAQGRFRIQGLLPGWYRLEVHTRGRGLVGSTEPTEVEIEAGPTKEVRIEVELAGRVEGSVRAGEGAPVARAFVRLHGDEHTGSASGVTRDDGTFAIEDVRPQDYRVIAARASASLRAPGTRDDDLQGARVTIVAGETARVELVVEDQSAHIRGHVEDESGGPIDDAFVQVERELDSASAATGSARLQARWSSWTRGPELTDQNGSFEITGLEHGKYTVFATRRGGSEGFVEHVDAGSSGVVVRFAALASISGTVALTGGSRPDVFTVTASDRTQAVERSEEFFATGGTWVLDDLPPGTYEIVGDGPSGRGTATLELGESEQRTGIELQFAPKVDVHGTVIDLESGAPIANVTVTISSRSAKGVRMAGASGAKENVTDANGAFTVRGAPVGKVRIALNPRTAGDDRYRGAALAMTIPNDVGSYTLAPLGMVKSRLKTGTRAGDLGFSVEGTPPNVDLEDAALVVAFVRPQGPAAATGLAVGDVIIAVDGHGVAGPARLRYGELITVPEGRSVRLTLERGTTVAIIASKPP